MATQANRMAQWLEALATTKLGDLSSVLIPSWWEEITDSHKLSSDFLVCVVACTCLHTYTLIHTNK